MSGFAVTSVHLDADGGAVVEFVLQQDFKTNGVQMHRRLVVPAADQYDDEIDAVRDAAGALLMDVLEDFAELEAMPTDDDEDEDED